MFAILGLGCILVAGASAAYSSSQGAGAGAGTWNGYNTYGAKYPYQQTQTQYGYTQQQPGYGGAGGFVSTGTGTGGGFTGTHIGFNNGFPFAPLPALPPIPSPYDYNAYVNQYLGGFASLYQQQQQFFNNLQQQFGAAQAAGYGGAGQGGYTQGGYGGGYAPNFAAASGTYGPGGVHQTASIYPNNPNSPNIDTRFGDDGSSVTVTSGQPGYVGVSTASFSSSSDIDGQQQNHREAVTSVNDNGKVTTYRVRS
jgi:hypothetical protein